METPSITHKYIPRVKNQRENNLFLEEYYSSTDVKIHIDDIEQTEIGYIGYSVQEQLKPLYGYASYTYDDMAVGNRIVTGTFKVPIKNNESNNNLSEVKRILGGDYDANTNYNDQQERLILGTEWINNTTGRIESMIEASNNGNLDDTDYLYIAKLRDMGYDVDTNSSDAQIKKAIRQFQRDHNILDGDGELTETTKSRITSEYEKG